MKKLSILLITLCLVTLTACGGKDKKDKDYRKADPAKDQVEVTGTVEENEDAEETVEVEGQVINEASSVEVTGEVE